MGGWAGVQFSSLGWPTRPPPSPTLTNTHTPPAPQHCAPPPHAHTHTYTHPSAPTRVHRDDLVVLLPLIHHAHHANGLGAEEGEGLHRLLRGCGGGVRGRGARGGARESQCVAQHHPLPYTHTHQSTRTPPLCTPTYLHEHQDVEGVMVGAVGARNEAWEWGAQRGTESAGGQVGAAAQPAGARSPALTMLGASSPTSRSCQGWDAWLRAREGRGVSERAGGGVASSVCWGAAPRALHPRAPAPRR